MRLKRYQMWSKDGLVWSKWFPCNGLNEEKWQLKNKQKNEYMDATEEEWSLLNSQQEEETEKKYKQCQ